MPDTLSKSDRKKTMRAVKGSKTSLERSLWSMLAGKGIRGWKQNCQGIIGKPDVAFPKEKVALFIDGCFWHKCPICNRPMPQTNIDYWEKKIARNFKRDEEVNNNLQDMGWKVIRIWEHEIKDKQKRLEILEMINNVIR